MELKYAEIELLKSIFSVNPRSFGWKYELSSDQIKSVITTLNKYYERREA